MYLVTGGTGFAGCYVTRELLIAGHTVAVFDLYPDLKTLDLVAGVGASQKITVVRGDVTIASQLRAAVDQFQPEVIIHLASLLPPDSEGDAIATLQQITQGHVNVLEAARLFGVRKIIWASASSSIFGRPERHGGLEVPVPNDAPHYPETLYGICKSTNERLSGLYWERFGVDSLALRFCQGYGPGRRRGSILGSQVFEKALLGLPFEVPYGDDPVNWQYVEDMAGLLVKASQLGPTRTRAFNTTGEVLPVRQAVELLSAMLPNARLTVEPGTMSVVWRFDTSRLEEEVGFGPPVRVAEGFRRTVATLQEWKEAGAW